MEITLMNRTNAETEIYLPYFEEIAANAEKILELEDDLMISVTFVRSRAIHKINLEYRGIDKPTDVISFAIRDGLDLPDGIEDTDLGDLFINIDYAAKQAKEYGHDLKREVCFLFTHGLLHCLGYDHMTEEDEKEMFALQDQILDPVMPR